MSPKTKAAIEDCRVLLAKADTPEERILWEAHLHAFELVATIEERKVVSLRLEREKRKK